MLKTTDWILTTDDVAKDVSTVMKNAKQRPLIVTEDGRPAAYVLSVEVFDWLFGQLVEQENLQLANGISEGERQFAQGKFVTLKAALAKAEAKWQAEEARNE